MKPIHKRIAFVLLALALFVPFFAWAQGMPAFTSTPGSGGSQTYSLSVQTLLLITALTFIPTALLMMTGFMRIVIVLALLRQALGTQTSPPNRVLVGMALFLTFFVMSVTFDRIYTEAYMPFSENKISFPQALDRGAAPLRDFMLKQTRESDLALFFKLAKVERPQTMSDIPMRVLIPAFVTSELKTSFQIGFIIYIPFLVIDMVVASVLMSMGMMMMSPIMISLPFKLMLFVLVDGWHLMIGSLVMSFAT